MAEKYDHSVAGDRALGASGEDKLGFRELARQIAISVADRATDDGLVIGIEGAWGSGKSSLIALVSDEIGRLPKNRELSIIDFRPWLIGNRDELISSLLGELSKLLDQVASERGNTDGGPLDLAKAAAAAEKAAARLRRFTTALSKAGSLIEVIGDASGFVPVKLFGRLVKASDGLGVKEPAPPQLSEIKDKLADALRELGHRFIVTIDDVDRLEPAEAIEILRLVRSVVDLPNIIYLLCYDSAILSHSITQATGVENGGSYLEKIVQLSVTVPRPETLRLRQWFSDDLLKIVSLKDEDERSRLQSVIDFEGERQLQTPRAVVKALDAIRFSWPALREQDGDLADLVWIQIIKLGNLALYRWIERYCATASVLGLGIANVGEAEKARELAALLETVVPGYFDDRLYRYSFAAQLPGVQVAVVDKGHTFTIFRSVSEREIDDAVKAKRISSPDHFRLYFAFAAPSHALSQEDISSILAATERDASETGNLLLSLHARDIGGGLTKADFLLDRVRIDFNKALTPRSCESLLVALSLIMDEALRRRLPNPFESQTLWDRAEKLVPLLLSRIEPKHCSKIIAEMFGRGAAISWLTSLFWHDMSRHKPSDDQARSDGQLLFTSLQWAEVKKLLLERYQGLSADGVLGCIYPTRLLFAWRQIDDEAGPRRLIEENIIPDERLVTTLEHLKDRISSSDRGVFYVLRKSSLDPFMDYENAKRRLFALENHDSLGRRAKELMQAFNDGPQF